MTKTFRKNLVWALGLTLSLALVFLVLAEPAFASATFVMPIKRKLLEVEKALVTLGLVLVGVALVVAIIQGMMDRVNWRWVATIGIAGALLAAFPTVKQFFIS